MKRIGSYIVFFSLMSLAFSGVAGQQMTANDYIERFRDMAIANMKEMGVPASITLSQGMLESGNGNSRLAVKGNNHFGIKCHSDWKGKTIHENDDSRHECFRKYDSVQESYHDHAAFLKNKSRYAFLFDLPVTDYKAWAHGLKKAGYATNPQYAQRLIRIIEEYHLYDYDVGVEVPKKETDVVVIKTNQKEPVRKDKTPARKKRKMDGEGSAIVGEVGLSAQREVAYNNHTPYVIAKKGDTFYRISKEFDMDLWQIHKYNDFEKDHVLKEGEKIYIKPKRRRVPESAHIAVAGETLHDISQKYGIKLKHLARYNNFQKDEVLKEGQKVLLRKPS
ncbi:MAG: glucosaminidase domain-containing protein [Flavobacteriales bacterium]|nr:glucosaminidase domain-containing protein [Flavobacteriales bacterium]